MPVPAFIPPQTGPPSTTSEGGGLEMTGRGPIAFYTTSVPRGPQYKAAAVASLAAQDSSSQSMLARRGGQGLGDGETGLGFSRPGSRRGSRKWSGQGSVGSPSSSSVHNHESRTLLGGSVQNMDGHRSAMSNASSAGDGVGSGTGLGDGQQTALQDANMLTLRAEVAKRKILLTEKWRRRIRGCCSSGRAAIPVWKYLLNGRRMVLSEREDLDTWLEFASLCRNGGNTALAERVLNMAQRFATSGTGGGGVPQSPGGAGAGSSSVNDNDASMERRIKFALLKQQWAVNDRKVITTHNSMTYALTHALNTNLTLSHPILN